MDKLIIYTIIGYLASQWFLILMIIVITIVPAIPMSEIIPITLIWFLIDGIVCNIIQVYKSVKEHIDETKR